MDFTMNIPGLKECIITNMEDRDGTVQIYVEMERIPHCCPVCETKTDRVHDYRYQKIKHLKWFERMTLLWYKRRRYACPSCGKRFSEKSPIVERYQRASIEWNQAVSIKSIKGKTFKEVGETFGASASTIVRRFDKLAEEQIKKVETLPSVIAIDEYKGDTKEGKYQLIIADGITRQPLDILPNRYKNTIKNYLQKHGQQVEVVIMDMSSSFKAAVQKALGKPIIVADRFHFCRYIYWGLDRLEDVCNKPSTTMIRKKCKRMKHVFHKPKNRLKEDEMWHLERYLGMSEELRTAHELKEIYKDWFEEAKVIGSENIFKVKKDLKAFYDLVRESELPEMISAIKTFQNWQVEILNSFVYNYSNGFLEGINNTTKVLKRNAFGFRSFKRFRAKILLARQYKEVGLHIG
ncbi:ISL3 family transposase [Radiobacillus deserti]|uniref:ISL3 family transposase n=1 Tax=Radiobacillus deserti TaxID=2594883 RepID=UPI001E56DF2A|nr:ISL3 family transposase [Radiobacillus deserti]